MIWWCLALVPPLLLLAVFIYAFHICFYSANKKPQNPYRPPEGEQYVAVADKIISATQMMDAVPFEPVTVKSFDGLTLFGRYYHTRDGAPTKIIFHGYRSMALRDGIGGFAMARELGMNVLTVDQRAHGKSDGHVITFGVLERRDCLTWIEYVNQRFGEQTPIVLSGLSMGAATVIMAASLPLPKNVVGILADCPYSSPKKIISKVAKNLGIPPTLAYPFIRLSAAVLGGFPLEGCSAIEAAGASNVPILILHGEDDRLVPHTMSQEIQDAGKGRVQLVTFPQAGHGLSYIIHPQAYKKTVFDFLTGIPDLKPYLEADSVPKGVI
ncbi:MAG: alpha/beta hydrolase [Ruminococcaceae bacterium]|nr:alpha/beta hydrolase [Oscillospiraceae bacterium]